MAGTQTALAAANENGAKAPGEAYLHSVRLIERLHRQLLDVIKDDLDRAGRDDVNSVQALLIYNLGEEEMSAGELRARGCYLGSNVSYNLKKLVEAGYLRHEKCDVDRRAVRISLTESGRRLRRRLHELFDRQTGMLGPSASVRTEDLELTNRTLARIERFWGEQIRYRL